MQLSINWSGLDIIPEPGFIDWSGGGPIFGEASGTPLSGSAGGGGGPYAINLWDLDNLAGWSVPITNIFGEPGSGPTTPLPGAATVEQGISNISQYLSGLTGAPDGRPPLLPRHPLRTPPSGSAVTDALDYVQGIPGAAGTAGGEFFAGFGAGFGEGINKALSGALQPVAEVPGTLTSSLANPGTLALLAGAYLLTRGGR